MRFFVDEASEGTDQLRISMKKVIRLVFVVTLSSACIALIAALGSIEFANANTGKLFATASALTGMAALLQLDISGFFERIIKEYTDDAYPYGPPSYINRHIIVHPDRPIGTFIRNELFFRPRCGLFLGLLSLAFSIPAAWL